MADGTKRSPKSSAATIRRLRQKLRDTVKALEADKARLRREQVNLARLALPKHPNGGFFNPLDAWGVQQHAKDLLDAL